MPLSVTVQRVRYADGRCAVFVGGALAGHVIPDTRRFARGWRVEYRDGRDLGDQRTRADAVDSLVSFATSPYRED